MRLIVKELQKNKSFLEEIHQDFNNTEAEQELVSFLCSFLTTNEERDCTETLELLCDHVFIESNENLQSKLFKKSLINNDLFQLSFSSSKKN